MKEVNEILNKHSSWEENIDSIMNEAYALGYAAGFHDVKTTVSNKLKELTEPK